MPTSQKIVSHASPEKKVIISGIYIYIYFFKFLFWVKTIFLWSKIIFRFFRYTQVKKIQVEKIFTMTKSVYPSKKIAKKVNFISTTKKVYQPLFSIFFSIFFYVFFYVFFYLFLFRIDMV